MATRAPRSVDEVREDLRRRLATGRAPVEHCDREAASAAIERLRTLDGEGWAGVWAEVAAPFATAAQEAEARGDAAAAARAHFQAYTLYYAGRYPCPNHPAKAACAERARVHYLAASRALDPPLVTVAIPFAGREGEGRVIPGYLRRPPGRERPPLVVHWGGIDGFKEQRHENAEALLAAGLASLAVDMPGTGECPVVGSPDAERLFGAILDWIAARPDVDAARVAFMGSSFGGYWATKAAHAYHDRLRAAVNWGGGLHFFFEPDWTEQSEFADSYLFELGETRAHAFGLPDYQAYRALAPQLSVLRQGLVDGPCCPLLFVNGKDDRQVPIADVYVMLEHGRPKDVRIFPGGHMGRTPDTLPTIVRWLRERLAG